MTMIHTDARAAGFAEEMTVRPIWCWWAKPMRRRFVRITRQTSSGSWLALCRVWQSGCFSRARQKRPSRCTMRIA